MNRRRRGIGGRKAIKKRKDNVKKMLDAGKEIKEMKVSAMKEQIKFFKVQLEEFAKKHKKKINSDSEFRHYFSQMCRKIGVDPLASSKGFWAEILGVGDFYYEIGIQIAQICFSRRDATGGLMELSAALNILRNRRKNVNITEEDVRRAIDKMRVLGNGFRCIGISGKDFIQSLPVVLSEDNTKILDFVKSSGNEGYSYGDFSKSLKWTMERVSNAMMLLQKEGMAWVDCQTESGIDEYWFPGLFEK